MEGMCRNKEQGARFCCLLYYAAPSQEPYLVNIMSSSRWRHSSARVHLPKSKLFPPTTESSKYLRVSSETASHVSLRQPRPQGQGSQEPGPQSGRGPWEDAGSAWRGSCPTSWAPSPPPTPFLFLYPVNLPLVTGHYTGHSLCV